ncbi:TlpA family protein disulfide reductase [Namhaeicola litoreus]|uniref:TlpA family protein disulfide reductase n=1 Tax=Namhaeicola litoreus TaxID=1052145 RepID=UPI0036714744
MRYLLFIFSITLFISCNKQEEDIKNYALLNGKVINHSENIIKLRDIDNKIIKEIEISTDGSFNDTLENIVTGYYRISLDKESSTIFLSPGTDISVNLDYQQFDETLIFEGNGSAENNYLSATYLKNENMGDTLTYAYLGSLDEASFIKTALDLKTKQLAFMTSQLGISEEFKELEEANLLYTWANRMQNYEAQRRYVSGDEEFKVSDEFNTFNEGLRLDDQSLANLSSYRNYLQNYYGAQIASDENLSKDYSLNYIKLIAKEVENEALRNSLLYANAQYGITFTSEVQPYYDIFMASSSNEEHKKEITEKYEKLIKVAAGKPSPKFINYENIDGTTTSLDDLKGKFVYVDVWATWCGPCKREIPHLKEITEAYKNKEIAFVSMSIDNPKDHDKWEQMVAEENLKGIQIFAPNAWESDFVQDYSILGIPRFILIDKEGNIVNANAPRPSQEELTELLNSLNI